MPVKFVGIGPFAVSSQVASTWLNAMSGFALVASTVAWPWLNPTVTIDWHPSSISRWMFAA